MGTSRSERQRGRAKRAAATSPASTDTLESAEPVEDTPDAGAGSDESARVDDAPQVDDAPGAVPEAGPEPEAEPEPDGTPDPELADAHSASEESPDGDAETEQETRVRHENAGLLAAIRRTPRERAWWIGATLVLATATVVMAVLVYQMVGITHEWEHRSEELDAANYALGEQIGEANTTITQQTDRITLLTQQLDTAKTRISELADQTANFDDDRAYMAQQIELLSGYVGSASSVANALGRCVDGQEQLVTYLKNADDYEPQELLDYETSVNELCTAAQNANSALQAQLSE